MDTFHDFCSYFGFIKKEVFFHENLLFRTISTISFGTFQCDDYVDSYVPQLLRAMIAYLVIDNKEWKLMSNVHLGPQSRKNKIYSESSISATFTFNPF